MLDRLTGLEVFAKVAGAGSLSAAARAMGMSQTMVTKHIAALESRLGVKLFHRTTRRLSITEAGRNYLGMLRAYPGGNRSRRCGGRGGSGRAAGDYCGSTPRSRLARGRSPRYSPSSRAPSARHRRTRSQRPAGRSGRGGLGSRDPHRQSQQFEPDRAAHRALPHRRLRGAVLSRRRAAPRARWRASRSTIASATRCRSAPRSIDGCSARATMSAFGSRAICAPTTAMRLRAAAIAGQGMIHQPTFIVADDIREGTIGRAHLLISRRSSSAASMPCSCRTVIRRQGCARSSISSRAASRRFRLGTAACPVSSRRRRDMARVARRSHRVARTRAR